MTEQNQTFEPSQPTHAQNKQRHNPIHGLLGELDAETQVSIERLVKARGVRTINPHHLAAMRAALRIGDPKAEESFASSLRRLGCEDIAKLYLARAQQAAEHGRKANAALLAQQAKARVKAQAEQVSEKVAEFEKNFHCTDFILSSHFAGIDPAKSSRSNELFAKYVMPNFR